MYWKWDDFFQYPTQDARCLIIKLENIEVSFFIHSETLFFACGYPVVSAPSVEKPILSTTEWSWHTCQKWICYRCMNLVWTLNSVTLIWMYNLMPVSHVLLLCLYRKFWNQEMLILLRVSLFNDYFGYSGSLKIP